MHYVTRNPLFHRVMSFILCAILLLGMLPMITASSPKAHAATTNQLNIVARADYLYNIKWTAQTTCYGWKYNYTFYAGSTYRIPYGQPINSGYYVGFGVDVNTFINAANTPGSIFYTSRSTYGSTSSLYYATDCSAFVSWCWGTSRKTTYSIPQVSTYIGMATQANTSLLQVGDALNSNDVGHVVLVTDLVYNSSGALTSIEITEQTPPQLKRSYYTPYELGSKYGSYYGIYRYYGSVPAAPDGSTGSVSGSGSSSSSSKYYPACDSSYVGFYDAMASIGVTVDWDLHCRIAEANGITDFSGTAEQNETLLALLKAGKLINPDYSGSSSGSTDSGTVGDSVVDGKTGYDRGYAGGMAGTGEYKAFGLDVSSWQGSSLDFNRIKNGGYDYVILRAGTTNGKDEQFESYYTKAKAAGLDVGAYYYSYATSVSAVKTDMEDFLSYIEGKTFEYPIYLDYEDSTQQALSASLSQSICLTAMDMLAAEGYLVGMYTGKYFSTQLPMDTICAKYEAWIAHYLAAGDGSYDGTYDYTTYGPTYASQYGMYQFTDSVWINGYGPYDGDVCYKDYPTIVKTYGFNGYAPEGSSSSGSSSSGSTTTSIEGSVVTPEVTAKSFSLSFESEILVNFYYTVSDLTSVTEHGMLVFNSQPGTVSYDNADMVYSDPVYDSAKARYGITTDGIAAKEMGDTRYYVAFARLSDGTFVYSSTYDYSPKKYAANMLGKSSTSDAQKALCVAMLNYGAAAQTYFSYNTDSLMNADLTADQKALVKAYDSSLFTGAVAADATKAANFAATSTGFSKKSATVSFESDFSINYYFTPSATVNGNMTFYYWTSDAYAATSKLTTSNATGSFAMTAGSDGRYGATVSGIPAKALDDTYYVTGVYTDASGNTCCTGVIAYSLSKYCLSKAVDGNDMQELASATAMYGYYAKLYFA